VPCGGGLAGVCHAVNIVRKVEGNRSHKGGERRAKPCSTIRAPRLEALISPEKNRPRENPRKEPCNRGCRKRRVTNPTTNRFMDVLGEDKRAQLNAFWRPLSEKVVGSW